jgi:SOS response regulatory protein OraA/RecX
VKVKQYLYKRGFKYEIINVTGVKEEREIVE